MHRRRALVLGGSGYVGGAVVRELRSRDVDVWYTYHVNEAAARGLAESSGAHAVACDLSEPASVKAAVEAASKEGPLSVLVHAAGRFAGEAVMDVTTSGLDRVMQLAVRAPFLAVQEILRTKEKDARADVIFVGALDAGQSLPLPPHFAAGEGAKSALAMSLAKELGPSNVRVNAVSVGVLEGGMSGTLSEAMAKDFAAFSALGRRGSATEVARVIAFVALDSDFLTGKTIPVNGGL